METNYLEFKEMARETRREIECERDEYITKVGQMEGYLQVLDTTEKLMAENEKQREEIESLQQLLAEEKRQRTEMETKMNEMSKLSAGVAKKASQNDLEKALRIFLNTSKRKTMSKREAAKTVIMELLSSAKIEISDDVLELLDHLDDEQTEPKVVNVQGNYNDVHDNGMVKVNG